MEFIKIDKITRFCMELGYILVTKSFNIITAGKDVKELKHLSDRHHDLTGDGGYILVKWS